jgi:hypothetical protein
MAPWGAYQAGEQLCWCSLHAIRSAKACCCSSGAMTIEASIGRFLRMYRVFFSYFLHITGIIRGPFHQSNLSFNGNLTERVYIDQQRRSPQICLSPCSTSRQLQRSEETHSRQEETCSQSDNVPNVTQNKPKAARRE